ncbi:MarR family winged helix-turn-helix transcriptional regulator [Nocardia thailandica]|uniref:MarR family winged helix-turn-helix transcriptional regulator n=1 Tax=Nocardia thailandica TaxID=257275 RepID=A0ABW6PHL0_9NOCA
MQDTVDTSADDIVVDLLVTAGRLTRLAGSISDDDLPRAILRAMALLDEHGSLRVSEFARIDRCSQPAATALVNRLVDEGFATRSKDPEDSRAVRVELTDAGRDRLNQARRAFGTVLATGLADFDHDRLTRLATDMDDLLTALRAVARGHQ